MSVRVFDYLHAYFVFCSFVCLTVYLLCTRVSTPSSFLLSFSLSHYSESVTFLPTFHCFNSFLSLKHIIHYSTIFVIFLLTAHLTCILIALHCTRVSTPPRYWDPTLLGPITVRQATPVTYSALRAVPISQPPKRRREKLLKCSKSRKCTRKPL